MRVAEVGMNPFDFTSVLGGLNSLGGAWGFKGLGVGVLWVSGFRISVLKLGSWGCAFRAWGFGGKGFWGSRFKVYLVLRLWG